MHHLPEGKSEVNIEELYMTLEVYAHLRDLPQYAALKTEVEKKLKAANDDLLPKEEPAKPVVKETPKPTQHIERGR